MKTLIYSWLSSAAGRLMDAMRDECRFAGWQIVAACTAVSVLGLPLAIACGIALAIACGSDKPADPNS